MSIYLPKAKNNEVYQQRSCYGIDLDPDQSAFVYNYSLFLEKESLLSALEFLTKQSTLIQQSDDAAIKRILLCAEVGGPWEQDAREMVQKYRSSIGYFSDFKKRVLLPSLSTLLSCLN